MLQRLRLPWLGGSVGGMNRSYEGGTTEAGIRQELRADALPVLYDEAERADQRSDLRLQSVLALARSASSTEGAHTAKGTTHGHAMSFQIRSAFCLASIGGAVKQEADKTRICLLQLKSTDVVGPEQRREHWAKYAPRIHPVNVTHGRELMARTLGWLRSGRLDAAIAVFQRVATSMVGESRARD